MKKLFIYGTKNFAEMSHYFFSEDSDYQVMGFCVDGEYLEETALKGLPVLAYEDLKKLHPPGSVDIFIAIGVSRVNTLRAQKVRLVLDDGYHLASFVSSKATIRKDLVLKPNTMIMDHANVHPFVSIGYDTIIWSSSRVALKCAIGDHCWITSATLGDSSQIGDYSFIGLNATIAPFVSVGSHNILGAGALILQDTKDYEVYKGAKSRPSKVSSLRIRNLPIIQ